ncbi:hypothetical protein C9439_00750 [archaeon SCG-AAA382B04]|nr:hypothetical protein C9439_00750 [archaeon SCG-AAA382B04]
MESRTSKLVAIFVVILFLGMILSSMFGGTQRDVTINNYGLTKYEEELGEGQVWLMVNNQGESAKNVSIVVKLEGQVVNGSELSLQPGQTKQVAYDFNFRYQSDKLVVQLKNEQGKTVREIGASVVNYPTI